MISILIPTRKRPNNIKRLYKSAAETATNPDDLEFILYVDNDDSSYDDLDLPIKIIKGERIVLSQMWNECFRVSRGEILMHAGDDIIFRTDNWDTIVKEAFAQYPDSIVFVYGNDGSPHNGKFGTHGFIHRKWVETVGYFVPPYFSSDYNDTWLNDVAKMIGRHQHIPILTEHMHPDLNKAKLDRTHRDRIERHQRDNVGQIYDSKGAERIADANKLREVMS